MCPQMGRGGLRRQGKDISQLIRRRCRSLRQGHDFDARGVSFGAVDTLSGFLVVGLFRLEDVGNEFLRVAVVDGEPSALDLHHDAVTLFENVVGGVKINRERGYFARF